MVVDLGRKLMSLAEANARLIDDSRRATVLEKVLGLSEAERRRSHASATGWRSNWHASGAMPCSGSTGKGRRPCGTRHLTSPQIVTDGAAALSASSPPSSSPARSAASATTPARA